ncbi:Ku DNA-binding complex, Ku70 subunit [Polychaeton citri CBS 116435]|uniref:ATP-dependent DNA helicase II subunit 1 n=1 Tax=Polychaeton citri CBS 116435 TaxID=1314669 RepID=A0A9P4Q0N7_9PEZI|nr:Ku DNA-binding complex, Ku70 subunit [Polychaeton citri CBS 116435]
MSGSKPPYDRPSGEDEDDDDDEVEETGYKTVKDAVLFAIDVSASMLTKPTGVDPRKPDAAISPTIAALRCAYALMQQRIISNPNDMMGILLFGTEKNQIQDADAEAERSGSSYPHCYLLTDLDVPAAADVKALRDLVEEEEEGNDLLKSSNEEVSMANVLFYANQIFTTKAPNFSSRRLFLVTDNDYPHKSSRDARNSAAVRAKDLYDLGVTIELFPISHPDRGYQFDRSRFYNDIVYSSTPSDPEAPAPLVPDIKPASFSDGLSLLQSLLSSVASRSAPKRALFSNCPLELGPGLKIGVKGYILFKRQEPKRTCYVYLPEDGETPQIAVGKSELMADDTARSVEKTEIRKAYKFGGETISFTPEEMSKIRGSFGEPIIRVIGFKPIGMLPNWANTSKSTFIYPSEEDYVGSTRVFSALHQKLLRDQKMGLVWYIPRRNAVPVLAALLPGAEILDPETNEQLLPPGMHVHPLPFADDIRQAPDTNLVRAPDAVTDAMRHIVQNLQLPKAVYDPRKYPNPSLQWFYKILQALALEEDVPDLEQARKADKTIPRYRQIDKRVGKLTQDWGDVLDEEFRKWSEENAASIKKVSTGASKRSQPPANGERSTVGTKKVKQEDGEGITVADMRKAHEKNLVGKYTVAQLKAFLQSNDASTGSSKKADIVDDVTRFFESRMNIE